MTLQIGHPKRKLVFQPSIFRCYVSFREGKWCCKWSQVFLGGIQLATTWYQYSVLVSRPKSTWKPPREFPPNGGDCKGKGPWIQVLGITLWWKDRWRSPLPKDSLVRGHDKPRLMGVAPSTFQVVYRNLPRPSQLQQPFWLWKDLVLGLQPIEMKKGDPGYWQITTGRLVADGCWLHSGNLT